MQGTRQNSCARKGGEMKEGPAKQIVVKLLAGVFLWLIICVLLILCGLFLHLDIAFFNVGWNIIR